MRYFQLRLGVAAILICAGCQSIAVAQDGSGAVPTVNSAAKFLDEALARDGLTAFGWLKGGHYPDKKRKTCWSGVGPDTPGYINEECRVESAIRDIELRECALVVRHTVKYVSWTPVRPEHVVGADVTTTLDLRVHTIESGGPDRVYIGHPDEKTGYRRYFHLKDGIGSRVADALSFIKTNCQLRSDTGF